jgi:ribonuclease HII
LRHGTLHDAPTRLDTLLRVPSFALERRLLRSYSHVLAVDEVGRGAAAGPCSVGVVLLSHPHTSPPAGLDDSKKLSPARRTSLLPHITAWAPTQVGHASAAEIDDLGVSLALTLAFRRAYAAFEPSLGSGVGLLVLLDGSYDWVNLPPDSKDLPAELATSPRLLVRTVVRGDSSHTSLAAASIVAKCTRDSLMESLHETDPRYLWSKNKGYLSPAHLAAISTYGLSDYHRQSWSYPSPK